MSREALALPAPGAPRTIWVFMLDIDPAEIARWQAPDAESGDWPLPGVLGLKTLDPEHVEVFPEEQIGEYGLVRYLTEANGMSPASVVGDEAVLSSLPGVIVLVHSRAVAGQSGHFDPARPAHFVGRYCDAPSLIVSPPPPGGELTRGEIGGGGAGGGSGPARWRGLGLGAAAVVVLGVLLWWLL